MRKLILTRKETKRRTILTSIGIQKIDDFDAWNTWVFALPDEDRRKKVETMLMGLIIAKYEAARFLAVLLSDLWQGEGAEATKTFEDLISQKCYSRQEIAIAVHLLGVYVVSSEGYRIRAARAGQH